MSTCAMFAWISPTRIGVPVVTSVLPAMRCPPHTDTAAISARVAAAAISRARPEASATTAKPALANATKSDSP